MPAFADRPHSIWQMVIDVAAKRPDGEALVCGDERLTWRETMQRTEAVTGRYNRPWQGYRQTRRATHCRAPGLDLPAHRRGGERADRRGIRKREVCEMVREPDAKARPRRTEPPSEVTSSIGQREQLAGRHLQCRVLGLFCGPLVKRCLE